MIKKLFLFSLTFYYKNNISLILKYLYLKKVALNTWLKHQLGFRYLSLLGPAALAHMFERLWLQGWRFQAGRKKFLFRSVVKVRFLNNKVLFLVIVWWSFPLYLGFYSFGLVFLGFMFFFLFFGEFFSSFFFAFYFLEFFWGVGGYSKIDRHQVVWWSFLLRELGVI